MKTLIRSLSMFGAILVLAACGGGGGGGGAGTPPPPPSAGALDTTFNTTGKVTTNILGFYDFASAVAIQPDGKIVVAGDSFSSGVSNFVLVRYNAEGSLDTSFGASGKVITDIGSGSDAANAVAIQLIGLEMKIVAAGYSFNGTGSDFALVRYNANGTLDTTFDADGKVTTPIGSGNDYANAVAIQSDGKIVVAGYSSNGTNEDFALVRYNADGSLDTSFNSSLICLPIAICNGKVTTPIGSGNDYAKAVAIQPDGKIVAVGDAAGGAGIGFALVRYNANGTLDTSFGASGKVFTDIGGGSNRANAVAIQPDGKIVAAGNAGGDSALVRYNVADGSLDTSFGASGKVFTDIGGGSNRANAVAIQPDGKIVAAGNAGGDSALVRYNVADGSLDTSFGASGKVITTISGSGGGRNDSAQAVAIQPDGKIVAAGYAYNVDDTDFALARYLP